MALGLSTLNRDIEPSPRRHDGDTGHHARVDDRSRETGAPRIEYSYQVTSVDVACSGVLGTDTNRLATCDLLRARDGSGTA